MYQKNCNRCNRSSFSSSEFGNWICPVCGQDLTTYPFFNATTMERVNVKALSKEKKLERYNRSSYFSSNK